MQTFACVTTSSMRNNKLCLPLVQISSIKIKRFLYRHELKYVICSDMNASKAKTTFIFNLKYLKRRHNFNSFPFGISNKTGIINFAKSSKISSKDLYIWSIWRDPDFNKKQRGHDFCPTLLLKWVEGTNFHLWKAYSNVIYN